MLKKAIPEIKFPSIERINSLHINEPIVSLSEYGFIIDSQYHNQKIPGSYKDCYARMSVVNMLLKAQKTLPDGLRFKIYDAYRPICVQQYLWDIHRAKIISTNPGLDDLEIDKKTSFFVSKPSYDINYPFLHNTGGAIDLTLIDENKNELDMGTRFDDFENQSWSNHFEIYANNKTIRDNRRILYNSMILAGFTNLPSEWWHYDYGTKFWAFFKNEKPLYDGVLDISFPDRII